MPKQVNSMFDALGGGSTSGVDEDIHDSQKNGGVGGFGIFRGGREWSSWHLINKLET